MGIIGVIIIVVVVVVVVAAVVVFNLKESIERMLKLSVFVLSTILLVSTFQLGICYNRYNSNIFILKKRLYNSLLKSTATSKNDERIGIIIVDHGSKRGEANTMLLKLVEKYKSFSYYNIVEGAHMELADPSISVAFKKCVDQGANFIICHPFFLSKGRHVQEDIPALMKEASSMNNNINYKITEPLGVQDKILELIDIAINESKN